MDTSQLIAVGLTEPQARAYAHLLGSGQTTPPALAKELGLTRSNAYKILEKLEEMQLVRKEDVNKKFVFYPNNPLSLTNLVAEQRNIATQREEAVREVINDLLETFHDKTDEPSIKVASGHQAVVNAYRDQINLRKPIYFIRSRSDIPVMGFDAMHEIRTQPARHNVQRHGITPDVTSGPTNPRSDARSNIERTWMKQEDYVAPVEWSMSGSTLLIVLFGAQPHAIAISHPVVATAFLQLWQLLSTTLRAMPYYKDLPRSNNKS